jgi:hypothetical protein
MPTTHIVAQGEHMASIAAQYEFASYETIWNHPANASLRAVRASPAVLKQGDVVQIPDRSDRSETCRTGTRTRFQVRARVPMLRIRVRDLAGKPVANAVCKLTVDGKELAPTTDGEGLLVQSVPATARTAMLVVNQLEFDLRIGHLDPIDTPTGLRARLNNLGLYSGDPEDDDPDALRDALELFQGMNALPVDGTANDATVAKLKEIYGC